MKMKNGRRCPPMPDGPIHKEAPLIVDCTKARFDNEIEANKIGARVGHRSYKCRLCGSWHLTHHKPRSKRSGPRP